MRGFPLLAASLALAAVPATWAAAVDEPRSANLDSDPGLERVIPEQVCETTDGQLRLPQPACAEDQFPRRRIVVEDICAAQVYRLRISSVQDFVDRLRITEADGITDRPEIFLDLRSGATGRGGEIRVVRYGDPSGATCPTADILFRYPRTSTLGRLPRGASGRSGFSAFLAERSKRYRGKEVSLVELYVDRDDAFCCPSFKRVTLFRFARKPDVYVRYRTRVRRIKKR